MILFNRLCVLCLHVTCVYSIACTLQWIIVQSRMGFKYIWWILRSHTYLFQIRSPDIKRISFNMAASNEVLPLPLFPTITVSFPTFQQYLWFFNVERDNYSKLIVQSIHYVCIFYSTLWLSIFFSVFLT